MKRISFLLLCAAVVMITACSDNEPQTVVKKDALGLIVPQNNESGNLLLLEDGTLTRPVSGIRDFNSRSLGDKLFISYRAKGTNNGITNIAVTQFSEANDSTFTPQPIDSVSLEEFVYGATFSGQYRIANEDSTERYFGDITFTFGIQQSGNSTYTYSITPDPGESISGEGEFRIVDGQIIFENNDHTAITVPIGAFITSYGSQTLYLWPVEYNGLYFNYVLQREE